MSDYPLKYTPLYETTQALGAQFVETAAWHIPALFTTADAEVAVARRGVALADLSAKGKIIVQGQQAERLLLETLALPAGLEIGQGRIVAGVALYRLRADRYFINTPPGAAAETVQTLNLVAGMDDQLFTVTDVTHGRFQLQLIGPQSGTLLSLLCGLDFHEAAFANMTARQSSVAKTTQLIIRHDAGDLPAYSLTGARSLAAYLWQTMMEAGRSLDMVPIGQEALDILLAKV